MMHHTGWLVKSRAHSRTQKGERLLLFTDKTTAKLCVRLQRIHQSPVHERLNESCQMDCLIFFNPCGPFKEYIFIFSIILKALPLLAWLHGCKEASRWRQSFRPSDGSLSTTLKLTVGSYKIILRSK